MKEYPNFSKYFNTNPRLWIVASCVVIEALLSVLLLVQISNAGAKMSNVEAKMLMYVIVLMVYVLIIFGVMYKKQITLVNAQIGKDLKRRGYNVSHTLEMIDKELENPLFSQLHSGISKSANFIITENWIVGSDDLIAMRANALAVKDVVSVETDLVVSYSVAQQSNNITRKQFSMLKITDIHNRCYSFFVLNPKCQSEAYDYIMNNIVNRNMSLC